MQTVIRNATINDVPEMHALIAELAKYERAEHEFVLSIDQLKDDGFGAKPIYQAFIATIDQQVVGMALLYTKYSTWKGKCIFLEDIIVTESMRGKGIGFSLFNQCIQYAKAQDAGRLEWQVLDWNTPAIEFYKKFAAQLDPTWINGKLTREQLQAYPLYESI